MNSLTEVESPFKNLGDWLIWRSTGFFGDFRIATCTRIIQTESERDGWHYQISYEDVRRIIARYKEHVSYWNAAIETIRTELSGLANSLGASYVPQYVFQIFDGSPSNRFPPGGAI